MQCLTKIHGNHGTHLKLFASPVIVVSICFHVVNVEIVGACIYM